MCIPISRIVFSTLTLSVAVKLGQTFSHESWGDDGLLAVDQVTASFALLLAIFQCETKSLELISLPFAELICLCISGIRTVILTEAGLKVGIAVAVSLGGWVFCMLNLAAVSHSL